MNIIFEAARLLPEATDLAEKCLRDEVANPNAVLAEYFTRHKDSPVNLFQHMAAHLIANNRTKKDENTDYHSR